MKGLRYATLVLVILGTVISTTPAGAQPLGTSAAASCYGSPAPVTKTSTGVRAGKVVVHCAGDWTAFQGILWFSDNAVRYGKWSYGGQRYVTGHGDTTIAPWSRPYHGCGYWKQRIIIGGVSRDSAVNWFCA